MLTRLFKRYYCIKQHDITDCGAACLAIVAKQYGLKLPVSRRSPGRTGRGPMLSG